MRRGLKTSVEDYIRLAKPKPKFLKCISRGLFRPYLRIKRRLTTPDVRLVWLDHLSALEHLPGPKEQAEDQNTNVGCEEAGEFVGSPWRGSKDFEAIEKDDERKVCKGYPGRVRLPPAPEDHTGAIDVLSDAGFAEAGVCVANGAPCEQRRDRGQVLEPKKDSVRTSAYTHVCEQRDGSCNPDAVVWNAVLVTLEEELRRLFILGDTEQVAGASVQEGISGRGGGSQDNGVDDVR